MTITPSTHAAVKNGMRARILKLLDKEGLLTTDEIAQQLGQTVKQIRDNSNQARKEGLIESRIDDVTQRLGYKITPAGREWVKGLTALNQMPAATHKENLTVADEESTDEAPAIADKPAVEAPEPEAMFPKLTSGTSEESSEVDAYETAAWETQTSQRCGETCDCEGKKRALDLAHQTIELLRAECDEAKEEAYRQENLAMRKHADCEDAMREAYRQQGLVLQIKADLDILRSKRDDGTHEAERLRQQDMQIQDEPFSTVDLHARTEATSAPEEDRDLYVVFGASMPVPEIAGPTLENAQQQCISLAFDSGCDLTLYRLVPVGQTRTSVTFVSQ